jgi:hypothetical protein
VIKIRDHDLRRDLLIMAYVQSAGGARFLVAEWPFRPFTFTAADDRGISYQISWRGEMAPRELELRPDPPGQIRWLDLTTAAGEPAIRVNVDRQIPVPDVTVTRNAHSPGELLLDAIAAKIAIAGLHQDVRGTIMHVLATGVTLEAGWQPGDRPRSGPPCRSASDLSVAGPRLWAMADSRLSVRDRELFLAEPHIAALSVSAGPDRGPLTVPIWYQYEPGGQAWILTPAESRKARLIEAAGRFTLMVERVRPTVRYVSVEGPVTRTIPGTDELLREITERYLRPEEVPGYLEFARTELGDQVAIYLRPQRWLSADLGPG